MNKFEPILFNMCVVSLSLLVALLAAVNIFTLSNDMMHMVTWCGRILSLLFVVPGIYLWIKHLRASLNKENSSTKDVLMLIMFTIPYALYLEKRSEKNL